MELSEWKKGDRRSDIETEGPVFAATMLVTMLPDLSTA
jgi:hypothetical protein